MGLTNSSVNRAIQFVGSDVIQKLANKSASASIDVEIAQTIAAADSCVETYNDLNRAEEALAGLYLSGIQEVVLRPSETSSENRQRGYRLLVPHDRLKLAATILQDAQVAGIKSFEDSADATKAMLMIRKKGIPATIRPLKNVDGDTKRRHYVVYVLSADRAAAEGILASGTNGDQAKHK